MVSTLTSKNKFLHSLLYQIHKRQWTIYKILAPTLRDVPNFRYKLYRQSGKQHNLALSHDVNTSCSGNHFLQQLRPAKPRRMYMCIPNINQKGS
jgi:hypothetical protein